MEVKSLDLTRQYQNIKSEIDKAISDVCASGMFCLGENVKKFEEEVASYIGVKHAIGVNSGSASLILGLEALGIGPGDEVIVPANTYIATIFAVSHVGATPVFVDHDKYYNIDIKEIKQKLNKKTKAIIAVHLYGQPCKMDELVDITASNGIFLIEDCAQAFGAEYKGKKVGSFGHVSCISFYPGKNLGAYGDGGMVLTNIDTIEKRLRMLRNDGQSEKYNHAVVGWNERLDAIQSVILSIKLKHLDNWNANRIQIANYYTELIKNKKLPINLPQSINNIKHVYHQYVVKLTNRDNIREKLWEKYQIGTGIHYPIPCHKQACYKPYNNIICSNTEYNANELLSLPIYPELKMEEVRYVVDCLEKEIKNETL